MITRHGQRTVKLDSLKLPGDIRERMKAPHVVALAESYKATGGRPMNAPWVDKETGRLVAGRDRTAAMMVAGIKEAPVEQVSGDPIDLARATIIENYHRRPDDRQKLARELAQLEAGKIEEEELEEEHEEKTRGAIVPRSGEELHNAQRGRPKTVKARAIERVARELHETPKTVEHLVRRAEAKEKKQAEPPKAEKQASPIKTMGLDVPATVLARAEKEQALIDKMDRLLTDLSRTYTEFEDVRGGRAGLRAGQYHASALRDAVTAFKVIRGCRPASVCPHCKAIPDLQKACGACRAAGFVGESDLERVEKCLLVEGDEAGVWVNGKWRTLISLRGDDF